MPVDAFGSDGVLLPSREIPGWRLFLVSGMGVI
jgi:hypothetical protein